MDPCSFFGRGSPQQFAAIDDEEAAGHVAAGVAGEVEGKGADFFGAAPAAHGDAGGDFAFEFGAFADPAFVGIGEEGAGGDGVDGDAVHGPVGGDGFGEHGQGTFGGLVAAAAHGLAGPEGVDGGDVDDATPFARDHRAADAFGEDEGLGEIEIEDALPVFEREILGGCVDATAADVVDEDVDGRVIAQEDIAEAFGFLGFGEIGLNGSDMQILAAKLLAGGVQLRCIRTGDDDLGSGFTEGARHFQAEAA